MGDWDGVCKSTGASWFLKSYTDCDPVSDQTGTSWLLKSYTDCDPVPDQIDNKNKKRMGKVPITLSNLALALL
jgi:hypothetical protein